MWLLHFVGYGREMGEIGRAGLWLATAALLLLLMQLALGVALQDGRLLKRRVVRGWHYWVMVATVLLVVGHVWLNG